MIMEQRAVVIEQNPFGKLHIVNAKHFSWPQPANWRLYQLYNCSDEPAPRELVSVEN